MVKSRATRRVSQLNALSRLSPQPFFAQVTETGALQMPALATEGALLVVGVTQLPSALGQLPPGERHRRRG